MPPKLADAKPITQFDPWVNACIYALEGAGKTTFVGTGGEVGKTIILDTEKSVEALSDPNSPAYNYIHNGSVVALPVENSEDVARLVLEAQAACKKNEPPADVIGIDTFSEIQERRTTEQLKRNHSLDSNRSAYIPAMSDYNERNEFLRRMIIMLKDLPMHTIITVHAKEDQDETTGQRFWRPDLSPKVAAAVGRHCNVWGYMTSKTNQEGEIETKLQIRPSRNVRAKTRIAGLPAVIEQPRFKMLVDALAKQIAHEKERQS